MHGPETVLLDEPLGKLDAMTRELIRADLQALWMQKRPTVVFVTHSIEEAVQLSNRVCVITPRPGRIRTIERVNLPRPRSVDDRPVLEIARRLRSQIGDWVDPISREVEHV